MTKLRPAEEMTLAEIRAEERHYRRKADRQFRIALILALISGVLTGTAGVLRLVIS